MGITTGAGAPADEPPIAQSKAAVQFRGAPDRIREVLVPPPLEPVEGGDHGWVTVADTVVPNARGSEDVPLEATAITEAAIGAPCRYEGERYTVYPLLFTNRPADGFKRGTTRGVADIAKTKWHAACPGRRRISAGDSVAGTASHRGEKLFDLTLTIDAEVTPDTLPPGFFDTVHYRYLPDPIAEGETAGLANDLTVREASSFSVGSVWTGEPTLSFGEWNGGVVADLIDDLTAGYHVTMGYEPDGDRVLSAVAPGWGDHIG